MLNKANGNMYPDIDFTQNFIKGECYHNCSYCYMKQWGKQKPIHLDEKEFKEFERDMIKYGEGHKIFIGSSCDMWADNIKISDIMKILFFCSNYNNQYIFQTKNPKLYHEFIQYIPINSILGITLETNRHYKNMNNSPEPYKRFLWFWQIKQQKFVTIEPIMDFDFIIFIENLKLINPYKIYIGADSKGHKLPEPSKEKILELIQELEKFTTVVLKKNLNRLIK